MNNNLNKNSGNNFLSKIHNDIGFNKKIEKAISNTGDLINTASKKTANYTSQQFVKLKYLLNNNSRNISWIVLIILFFYSFFL